MSSDCCCWQRPSRSGRSGAAVVKWSLNSREISEPRSLLPLGRSLSALLLLTRCHRPKKRLLASAAAAVGSLGTREEKEEEEKEEEEEAGGHSINDNLLASSSHCQLALNYDIIDPNLTSGGGGGSSGHGHPSVRPDSGGGRRGEYALSRTPGQVFFGPSSPSSSVASSSSFILTFFA